MTVADAPALPRLFSPLAIRGVTLPNRIIVKVMGWRDIHYA